MYNFVLLTIEFSVNALGMANVFLVRFLAVQDYWDLTNFGLHVISHDLLVDLLYFSMSIF